jgi:protocatechuate 3,4-dioxygenase beta subunit
VKSEARRQRNTADASAAPGLTPQATIGPFYPGAFVEDFPQDISVVGRLMAHRPQGQPIRLSGRFFDALGKPVPSVIIEVWQANAQGRYRHPEDLSVLPLDPQFEGFARMRTGDDGAFSLVTIKPGAHPVRAGSRVLRAPHLRLTIFASGIDRLVTQVFFEGEAENGGDPVLQSIPDPAVRKRLIAQRNRKLDGKGIAGYELDFVLRGERETPFFDDGHEFSQR